MTAEVEWRRALPPPEAVLDRRPLLLDLARGRRVLHLGCADALLLDSRVGTDEILHEQLAAVASTLMGVDLSAALDRLAVLVPGDYLRGDVERLDELDVPGDVEVVLAPEIIEHLSNPGRFLASLRAYLVRTGAVGFITTPNAYSWAHIVRFALCRAEWVHPDHQLVYTPATLDAALERAGLEATRWWAHRWDRDPGVRSRVLDLVDRLVLGWNPWLAPGLVVEVRPSASS